MPAKRRSVCFVTGTRAEFGLMRSTLDAIARNPKLDLQLVVTGMHLDRAHGRSVDMIRREGWRVDATVPWPSAATAAASARSTGLATAGLAGAFERLESEVVLVVGDRVEAFAAAAAAHVGGRAVAHVHGGDRALGQVDDSLRHAITKLAHVHFPATAGSARRIARLGEDARRIHAVGAPGIDGIRDAAAAWADVQLSGDSRARDPRFAAAGTAAGRPRVREQHADSAEVESERAKLRPRRYALLVLHPATANEAAEERAAGRVLAATLAAGFEAVVVVAPNNDPGARGILRRWEAIPPGDPRVAFHRDLPRPLYLGLLRDAAVLVGNSSSGIIEAASFGTPVLDIGPRQAGRERGGNVKNVPLDGRAIRDALAAVWRGGRPVRFRGRNVYGGDGAGERIARALAGLSVDDRLLRKLIAY
ncbi:MAG: UDP-N-acetylglucosamine 2-epimerase [uncultured Phycisphaerae bacterium]|uniref:UDP-N-acetylglucosamine 2-epimerase n=1 Tax=uncultured Phycisphaerae bacterium TaxID=904963 RepID=A0A6J4NM12_9BACT|nr:MAG: UDP-N-acetylglucosamine 2-epimerase [uncultured Phycisphaerae bacterium]